MKRWAAAVTAMGLAASAGACASILGIETGVLDNAEGGLDGGVQICVADGGDHPDTGAGLFVYGDVGTDTSNCGDESTPCKTITYGISRAATARKTTVYVAVGSTRYLETVTLVAGISIEGGWTVVGAGEKAEWARVCKLDDPTQLATIVGTESATIRAADLGGEATLRYLAVSSKVAGAGESVYGVFATGPSTRITLDHVLIDVGPGGNGASGAAGTPGELVPGACTPGDAGTSKPGDPGGAAPLSVFGPSGVLTDSGTRGLPGPQGENGPPGKDGSCTTTCYTCELLLGPCPTVAASCGARGSSGCGGSGGGGGAPGQSGGSAVGIYSWAASITATGGKIVIGAGGSGGAGGTGGAGGEGGVGPNGASGPSCSTACASLGVCSATTTATADGGGGTGTRGGDGANGGMGGGGSGGDAYGIVSGLDASVTVPDGTISHQSGGSGGAVGGQSGVSGDRFP